MPGGLSCAFCAALPLKIVISFAMFVINFFYKTGKVC